ncbi:class I adenylate-forming enzyme family protein [Bradyrhizobium sp. AUGA SZCCT0431]|uniref:class I adenylate-forming enzyme family protein n=1 Tax=Bradyrhizobium sp. AUGA SZCCT0431 TaxID=2807674 RepID=UPI001BAA6FB1|nr:AMP-binding protein [Bradyrhizobium sp. AUGA SZCCT0431]MBR1146183.1 AMP-binding protein [Bradyrhizobium sp. AUGA SZCCT0431]
MRIADYLEIAADRFPEREAIVFGSVRMTYAEAARYAHAIANRLRKSTGSGSNANIGIYSPNDHRITLLELGINRAGLAWVAVHDRNSIETNAQVISFMDCEMIFYGSTLEQSVAELKQLCPGVREWICIDAPSSHGEALDQWIEGCWQPFPWEPVALDNVAFIMPTGGTTGPSKGAVHTQRSAEAEIVHLNASHYPGRGQIKLLTIAPLSHVAGLFALALLPNGGTNFILRGFSADEVLDAIECERITHLFLPPTLVSALLAHPRTATADFSSLVVLTTGAAPIAPEKFKEAVRVFGPVMWEGFGQSETLTPVLIKRPEDYIRADGSFNEDVLVSAGRAWDYVDVRILDDNGAFLPAGERGEIAVRSSCCMSCYYKNPQATAETLVNGYVRTGDIGVMSRDGFVTILDRKKDMIVTGGFNVFPAEVEAIINEHPAVLDCIVVGVPDDRWGEAVRAVVQLKSGMSVSENELIVLCKQRLGGVKSPKVIEIWPDLPRSAVGKLLRREVRSQFWKDRWRSVG